MSADPLRLVKTRFAGRYAVESYVAEGGFAYVYLGRRVDRDGVVALKLLKLEELESVEMRERMVEQFRAEASVISKLQSPAVVPVFDFDVSPLPDGTTAPWMALEWVAGITLDEELKAHWSSKPRSPAEVLRLMRPVLVALAEAHALGIAHRDIKPTNLMITGYAEARDDDPRHPPVRLLDFGISKVLQRDERHLPSGETMTRSATIACSVDYAAPEQVSGGRTGPWTDVYQLALVLTEMLTHHVPYAGDSAMAVRLQVLSPARPTPSRFGFDVGAWEPVLARALSMRAADRYADAGALLDALERALPEARSVATPGAAESTAWARASSETVQTSPPLAPPLPQPAVASAAAGEASRANPIVAVLAVVALAVGVALAWFAARG